MSATRFLTIIGLAALSATASAQLVSSNVNGVTTVMTTDDAGTTGLLVTGTMNKDLALGTRSDNTLWYPRLWVKYNSGNIGIGTSAPGAKLDVAGNMRMQNEIKFTNGDAMKGLVWSFGDFSNYNSRIDDYNGNLGLYTDDNFYIGGINTITGTPGDAKFYLNTVSGNVGIGTTEPLERLHVNGTGRFSGLKVDANNALELGTGLVKESEAGKICYGCYGAEVLHIVGAGTTTANRKIKLYAEGGMTVAGNVGIGATPFADIQLNLGDIYAAGGKNLLVGDDTYLSDVDVANVLGIYGNADNAVGGIKLGSNGPVLWGQSGTLSIGTGPSTPVGTYKLFVEGGILTEKLRVALKSSADWADHVFTGNYQLMPLEQVAAYIGKHKHLPGVPSAEKLVAGGGIDVNEMFAKQMEKIEELTLYVIDLNRKMAAVNTENQQLKQNLSSSNK